VPEGGRKRRYPASHHPGHRSPRVILDRDEARRHRPSENGLACRPSREGDDRQAAGASACDTSKQRIETDGCTSDAPKAINRSAGPFQSDVAASQGCADQIQATSNGDPKWLGFRWLHDDRDRRRWQPIVASMDVTQFEATTLDAALFRFRGSGTRR